MNKTCDDCLVNLIEGILYGGSIIYFLPTSEEKKFIPKFSKVTCDVCPKCGKIYNLRVLEPGKLVRK